MEGIVTSKIFQMMLHFSKEASSEEDVRARLFVEGLEVVIEAITKHSKESENGTYGNTHELQRTMYRKWIQTEWLRYPKVFNEVEKATLKMMDGFFREVV